MGQGVKGALSRCSNNPSVGTSKPRNKDEHRAHRVRQDISGGNADGKVARHLQVEPGHPTVVVRRTYFGWDGDTIVTADLHYRLEKFRQAIDLFRENVAPY